MRYKQTVVVFVVAIALLTVKAKGGEQEPRKTSEQLNSVEVDVGGATSYANVDTRNGAPKTDPSPTKIVEDGTKKHDAFSAKAEKAATSRNTIRGKHIKYNPYILFAMLVVPLLLTFCRQKLFLWSRGILFMFCSMEKRGMSKAPDTSKLVMGNNKTRRYKTIVFIRHGESDWNEIFNKSKLLLFTRLIRGLFREAMLFMSDHSVFIDSPLSKKE